MTQHTLNITIYSPLDLHANHLLPSAQQLSASVQIVHPAPNAPPIEAVLQQHPAPRLLLLPDGPYRREAPALAAALQWPLYERVTHIQPGPAHTLEVAQHVPGEVRYLRVRLPAIIALRSPQPHPYTISAASAEATIRVQPPEATPRLRERLTAGTSDEIAQRVFSTLYAHDVLSTPPIPPNAVLLHTESAPVSTLANAHVIIAGGKGLGASSGPMPPGTPDPFAWRVQHAFDTLIKPLAALLNAEVTASRAVIDGAGLDASLQIGQSGRSVAPELYLAAGISGAVQHQQGIANSRFIVAINPDAHAPIFEHTDIGIVARAEIILPALIRFLQGRKGSG